MKFQFCIFLFFLTSLLSAKSLPGFKPSGLFNEQQLVIENSPPGTRILINAPLSGFGAGDRVLLVLYALPNGNTIEQTFGKRLREGDDWHYDIQHIGAQTRFLRQAVRELLKDPVLFRVLSNEDLPFEIPFYYVENNPD